MAKNVSRAPPGKVAFERVSEQQLLGQVVDLPSTKALPGLIRYLVPDSSKVLHIPFGMADVMPHPGCPPGALLEAGCFALFNICTDTRAEASALLTLGGVFSYSGLGSLEGLNPERIYRYI